MRTEPKTPTLKTLPNDFVTPFNQLLPPGPLSNGQPGVIQHAGLTKREYFATKFLHAHLCYKAFEVKDIDINEILSITDRFIEALNK